MLKETCLESSVLIFGEVDNLISMFACRLKPVFCFSDHHLAKAYLFTVEHQQYVPKNRNVRRLPRYLVMMTGFIWRGFNSPWKPSILLMEQDQLLWQASNKYHLHIVFPTIPQKKSNSDFAHQEYNQKESENRITYSKKLKKRFLGTTYRPPPIQKSNNQKNHIKTPQILIFERNLPLENFSHHTSYPSIWCQYFGS